MVIEAKINLCGQNIETRYYRDDTDYHNLHAIVNICMILVHLQKNVTQNTHGKFEVNSLHTS